MFVLETLVLHSKALALATLVTALHACSSKDEGDVTSAPTVVGSTLISTASGTEIGAAEIIRTNGAISISVMVDGLEVGERALHLHSIGNCDAPDFASAGGHLNPFGRAHGSLNPDGQHLGDMPNITTDNDGQAKLAFTFSDSPDHLIQAIFDADGTAVMIHAGPDDYISDPAGAAGPRIACGVVEPAG